MSDDILLDTTRKTIFRSKSEIVLSDELHWGLFGKICNSISQKTTLFKNSKSAPHLSPRSLWGYLYKCSPQRTVVGVPTKKGQIIFHWIPVGKQSFDQRVRLEWVTNFTEGSLERYATLSVKQSHFFVGRRQTKEEWWGWMGCASVGNLPHQKLFSRPGTRLPLETSATHRSKEWSRNFWIKHSWVNNVPCVACLVLY